MSIVKNRIPVRLNHARFSGLALLSLSLALGLTACGRLQSYRESIRERHQLEELAELEPIDAHTHIGAAGPAFTSMLVRLHMHVLDILYVDNTTPDRATLERQRQDALKFIASSNGHASLCTTFDPFRLNDPDFQRAAIEKLNQDFLQGAVAVKIWKNVGMQIKNSSGQYIMPDDPVFAPIYRDIAEHRKTLVAHLAEPDAAWDSQDASAPNAQYYADHPQWDMSKQPGAPAKATILEARDRVLALNPDLRVVGAHLGSMEGDLDGLAKRLDLYPNFAVDTAARVTNLVIQPRDKVRAFLLKYQDRVLYGTDLRFESASHDEAASHAWESKYAADWRYFATPDTFDYKGHPVEGLNLPRSVLKKLYHDNAVRWIRGIDSVSN